VAVEAILISVLLFEVKVCEGHLDYFEFELEQKANVSFSVCELDAYNCVPAALRASLLERTDDVQLPCKPFECNSALQSWDGPTLAVGHRALVPLTMSVDVAYLRKEIEEQAILSHIIGDLFSWGHGI
jgi:hypothetical protein